MSDYPYIRANAERVNWNPLTLMLVLNQARKENAPADTFTYAPGIYESGKQKPAQWLTLSGLQARADAGCEWSRGVIDDLQGRLGTGEAP